MGGKLFGLDRVPREEYLEILQTLRTYLDKKFADATEQAKRPVYRIPRWYDSKPDFGDVDILLAKSAAPNWTELRKEIAQELGVTRYETKGDLSMCYQDRIQVDIMPVPDQYLDTTWQFLCYNDLGNLLGKIFRRFNLKYGEKGLFYVYRRTNDESYRKDILLTQDMPRILGFLKLSYEEWDQGFSTLENMFDWVIACPYFTSKPFHNLTTATSKRARLRTTMRKFVDYVEQNNVQKEYPFEEDRSLYIPMIEEYFPEVGLAATLAEEETKAEREAVVKSKFNGRLIMQTYPALKGPSLGQFIQKFKEQFEDFDNAIYEMDAETLNQQVESFYQTWPNSK